MNNDMQHEMVISEIYPTGAQEWYCPSCGRRYILQWPPAYSKIVLEVGDEMVIHVGGTSGVQMGSIDMREEQEDRMPRSPKPHRLEDENIGVQIDPDDPDLSPFSDWLNGQNL